MNWRFNAIMSNFPPGVTVSDIDDYYGDGDERDPHDCERCRIPLTHLYAADETLCDVCADALLEAHDRASERTTAMAKTSKAEVCRFAWGVRGSPARHCVLPDGHDGEHRAAGGGAHDIHAD